MVLINSGVSRDSSLIIEAQKTLAKDNDNEFLKKMSLLKAAAYELQLSLLHEDLDTYFQIMTDAWELKKASNNLISNELISTIEKDVFSSGGKAQVPSRRGWVLSGLFRDACRRNEVLNNLHDTGYVVEPVFFTNIGVQSWKMK